MACPAQCQERAYAASLPSASRADPEQIRRSARVELVHPGARGALRRYGADAQFGLLISRDFIEPCGEYAGNMVRAASGARPFAHLIALARSRDLRVLQRGAGVSISSLGCTGFSEGSRARSTQSGARRG